MRGTALQKLGRGADAPEHVTMNVAVFEGRTSAVFAWLGEENGPTAEFVASLACLPEDRMADAVVRVAVEYMENVYFRPSWWEGLDLDTRTKLTASVWNIAGNHRPDCLADRGMTYATAQVVGITSA